MTAIKLDGKPATAAGDALAPHAQRLYATPGMRIIGVVELAHVERTEPAPDEDKEPSVKLRITHLELANAEQEAVLREAQRALYLHRTAQGTLGEDGDIELARHTLAATGNRLTAIEAARLHVALQHWADYGRRVLNTHNVTVAEMRHELDAIVAGLDLALAGAPDGP